MEIFQKNILDEINVGYVSIRDFFQKQFYILQL